MITTEVLLLFGFVTLLTYCFIYFWKRRRLYELAGNLPGHDGLSFIDSVKFVTQISRKSYISKLISFIKDDAPLTKLWLFNHLIILSKDAKFINKIFNIPETYNKPFIVYQVFTKDNALPALNGNEHKRHRKIINKAFMTNKLQKNLKAFDEKSKKNLKLIDENVDGKEFELMDYVGVYSLESFGKTNLNYETEYFHSELFKAFSKYMELSMDCMPYQIIGLSHKFLGFINLGGERAKILRSFQKFIDEVLKSNRTKSDESENSLINLMLDPKFEFTKKEIDDELIIGAVASFDTTSRTISTILMMLGIFNDVQQKVMTEINEICNSQTQPKLTLDFLQKFSYLEAVIQESMRLFPEGPFIAREPSSDVDVNGFLIPKGAVVLISIFSMHRNEKYWGSDAHEFKPERFLEELKFPSAFAPFAGGKRICIGYRYAMISMKIFLINFLQNYKVDCSTKFEEIEIEVSLALNFVNGYKVSIQRR